MHPAAISTQAAAGHACRCCALSDRRQRTDKQLLTGVQILQALDQGPVIVRVHAMHFVRSSLLLLLLLLVLLRCSGGLAAHVARCGAAAVQRL